MRKTILALLALAAAMLAVPAAASAADTALVAKLTGKAEVPGPGDSNGKGFAAIVLDDSANQVCFVLSWNKIGTAVAAHIHKARAGVAGDIVLPLFAGTPTKAGCVGASASLIKQIKKKPESFYVNVHSTAMPGGAIRGQLAKPE